MIRKTTACSVCSFSSFCYPPNKPQNITFKWILVSVQPAVAYLKQIIGPSGNYMFVWHGSLISECCWDRTGWNNWTYFGMNYMLVFNMFRGFLLSWLSYCDFSPEMSAIVEMSEIQCFLTQSDLKFTSETAAKVLRSIIVKDCIVVYAQT